jgi:hypothetical protein
VSQTSVMRCSQPLLWTGLRTTDRPGRTTRANNPSMLGLALTLLLPGANRSARAHIASPVARRPAAARAEAAHPFRVARSKLGSLRTPNASAAFLCACGERQGLGGRPVQQYGRQSFGRHPDGNRKGPMRHIRPIIWLPILAVAGLLLVSCAEPTKPSFIGPNGPPDERALQECRGEVAKAQVPGTAPADVRAEVAQGAMASCMAKKGFYQQ